MKSRNLLLSTFTAVLFSTAFLSHAQGLEERLPLSCPEYISSCTVTPVGSARVTAFHCFRDCIDPIPYRYSEFLDLLVLEEGIPDTCTNPEVGERVYARGWFDYPHTFLSIPSTIDEYRPTYRSEDGPGRVKMVINIPDLVHPGFSGGPLRDDEGRVVGMIYAAGIDGTSVLAVSEICNFLGGSDDTNSNGTE